jgi:inward rectifier potassium channel
MENGKTTPTPASARGQFLDQRGRVTVERRGMPKEHEGGLWKDAYHAVRTWSWPLVTFWMFAMFVAVNFIAALVLWIGQAKISNANGGLWDYFWFSVETMATIGYGNMAPQDALAHTVVTVESFVGILVGALVTGIVFSRFSTPSARIIFSDRAVIGMSDGVPTLMFRMANARQTAIIDATIKVYISQDETLSDGEQVRRIYDLTMRRNTSPLFALSWVAYHAIDGESPLFGATPESVMAKQTTVIINLTGIDDRLAATVHSRYSYSYDHIAFGSRFVDIFKHDPNSGKRYLDMARFHDIESVDAPRV